MDEFDDLIRSEIGDRRLDDSYSLDNLTEASGLLGVRRVADFDECSIQQLGEDEWYQHVIGGLPPSRVKKSQVSLGNEYSHFLNHDLPSDPDVPILATQVPTPADKPFDVPLKEEDVSLGRYLIELCTHVREPDSIRGRQSRLTMWEILEHFDFLNDLFFICRVGVMTKDPKFLDNPYLQRIGSISILYLICIWMVSAMAYGSRSLIIYHRILPQHRSIFHPFIVFSKIRSVGSPSPETLYMFERLSWTYQLVMRLFEDIPQLVVSAVFLANFGQNFYTYFMIAYSCMLMVITSVRMGLSYPLFGTLSLLLSRAPPVDSPVLYEACPTTRNFALFVSLNFGLWCITNLFSLCFVRGVAFAVFLGLALAAAALSAFFAVYWVYLNREGQTGALDGPLITEIEFSGLNSSSNDRIA